MADKKRKQNEKEYPNWTELEDGKRLYWKEIDAGDKSGKKARYEKIVDSEEQTVSFVQKIFDNIGNLTEIHEKFPIDKGHIILMILIFILGAVAYNLL
ncbi:MAG: hypothetical protein SFU99_05075 [Saprospiraceae bacterium]|nr:hypothetical protein [Saprospiraceae bacterium]